MYLEIISPEATLFTGNIDSLTVPTVMIFYTLWKKVAGILAK